ncbi:hypothetical protein A0H81_07601 [Grifola frondosa]|uniref:PH domain-containing protein n=1 Tax=Grifola frondosa TaxID=5627 RepID=A0A1C7M7I6_GRIFR|nr:hypothetical protein A0H81_07601 [Grifola frondosa]
MTSVSQPGTTSPKWDSRNQGFISPAQLQLWKQQQQRSGHEYYSQAPHQAPQEDMRLLNERRSADGPPSQPPKPQHRATASFSFFRHKTSNQESNASLLPAVGQLPANPPSSQFVSQQGPGSPNSLSSPPSEQQPTQVLRRSSTAPAAVPPPPLHPEIRSVVQLTLAHAHKVYFSGPLVRRIERQPDGQRPTKDEDAFVHVLGSVTLPATSNSPSKKYSNVLTLNTAGSNLFLFSCPSPEALMSWTAALRLSAWEKSRLEEIYTAHLIRVTLNDGRAAPTTLTNGRMEGWVRIRIAGQTDWKRMWMVVTAAGHTGPQDGSSVSSVDHNNRPGSPAPKKKRFCCLS